MSLKPILDSLEGLHEEVAKLYIKKDGKFVLDVEDTGLKSALQKERDRADTAEKALKAREDSEAAEKAKKDREDLERKGEYEKLSAADKAALKAAEEKSAALEAKFRLTSRDRYLQEVMREVHAIPEALGPHVRDLFEDVPDGDGFKHVVKGDAGKKASDFLATFKETKPWAFEATGATGTGSPAHQPGAATGTKARYDELMGKKDITPSEGHELVRLGNELSNPTTK